MKIYLNNEINFNTNGLGYLTDAIDCKVYDEKNGNYSLTLEYLMNGQLSEHLEKGNIIKCKVADGTEQLFRIVTTENSFKTKIVTAKHIFYDLLNNFIADTYPQSKNGKAFLEHILNNLNFSTNFIVNSDITNLRTARYIRMNPVLAIMGDIDNSMVKIFGGELKRDNFTINFLSRIGNDNGVKLIIGKNITGINITTDISNMATRVMPIGFHGLLLPELYVDSPLINNYPTPKIASIEFNDVKYDPEDVEAYNDLESAFQALRNKVNEQYSLGLDKPQINIKIDWVELSKTEEYKNFANLEKVNLGDTITAEILGINYETRVLSTVYDVLKDRIINFEIGTFNPTIVSEVNNILSDIKNNTTSIIQTAQANATQLINSAMGGYIYKTQTDLFIMDNENPNSAQKVWRWNLNGLGYSNTGINGPFNLAMTMDGSIVADFITTGRLDTSLIEGYDSLLIEVNDLKTKDVTEVTTTTGFTFNQAGLTIAKSNSQVKSNIDEAGLEIDDTSSGNDLMSFYSGLVDSDAIDKESSLENYEGKTIVYTRDIVVKEYIAMPNGRFENVQDNTHGKGIGLFI